MREATRLYLLLVACVRPHDWRQVPLGLSNLVSGRPLAGLPGAACEHRVEGCVFRSLEALDDVDPAVMAELGAAYSLAIASHLRALTDLAAIGEILAEASVPWLCVKGPVLTEVAYRELGLRTYGDLDIVVPPAELGKALDALEAGGCQLEERDWTVLLPNLNGEVHVTLPHGTPGDVHWHLINDGELRRSFRLPMAEMMQRARPVRLGGNEVLTLDSTDTLLHLTVHACTSGGRRLVWLKDIERTVCNTPPEWPALVERADRARLGLVVATMLAKARRVLGVPVPDDVLRSLAGRNMWSQVVRLGDAVSSKTTNIERGQPGPSASRATRDRLGASAWQLGLRGLRWARSTRRPDGVAEISGALPPGDQPGRQEFLDAVARRGWDH
jgi:Uncharacterised nucleotidyltransferase